MLRIDPLISVYVFSVAVDLRQGFDRLSALASSQLNKNVTKGGMFVFFGRNKDRVKILYWDRDGLAIWYKRLEAGTFKVASENPVSEIAGVDLESLLSGMELKRIAVRKKFS